jgi:heme/copper-type cytochrome/quinol oxidase subunit 3
MQVTLLFGAAFLASQIAAWMSAIARSYHGSSQTPFFFYLFTMTHALCVFGGAIALGAMIFAVCKWGRWRRRMALSTMALYWHFTCVLWLYTLALLLISIGR